MFIDKIPAQTKDGNFNVIIEISMNTDPVKYEFDKEIGMIKVDRFMQAPMFYPCNYGFIPHTLAGDGDPVDVLLMSNYPVIPGALVMVRTVGVLTMKDDSGLDEKILAVPIDKLDISFTKVKDIDDVSSLFKSRVTHFFEHYKKLEAGKWTEIIGWENKEKANSIIAQALKQATIS